MPNRFVSTIVKHPVQQRVVVLYKHLRNSTVQYAQLTMDSPLDVKNDRHREKNS